MIGVGRFGPPYFGAEGLFSNRVCRSVACVKLPDTFPLDPLPRLVELGAPFLLPPLPASLPGSVAPSLLPLPLRLRSELWSSEPLRSPRAASTSAAEAPPPPELLFLALPEPFLPAPPEPFPRRAASRRFEGAMAALDEPGSNFSLDPLPEAEAFSADGGGEGSRGWKPPGPDFGFFERGRTVLPAVPAAAGFAERAAAEASGSLRRASALRLEAAATTSRTGRSPYVGLPPGRRMVTRQSSGWRLSPVGESA
mmetsp:Transcript_15787/g.42453  ORF Transcript_15787/g.42453 Transcript_15787/m.42453 type:complete len:253 (-) Transcript_15787:650-1408(-)